jgi:hypothetical protein
MKPKIDAIAYARFYPNAQITFDPEPWFVNAGPHDLQKLKAELQHETQPEYHHFRGPVTNSIFHWINYSYPTAETRKLAQHSEKTGETIYVILEPDNALNWITDREGLIASREAVDAVLRSTAESAVDEMLRSSPARTVR